MPIDIETFNKGTKPADERQSSVTPAVETFLKEHTDEAFTTAEIAGATGANKATVNHVVRKFAEKKLLERKQVEGKIYNRWIGT